MNGRVLLGVGFVLIGLSGCSDDGPGTSMCTTGVCSAGMSGGGTVTAGAGGAGTAARAGSGGAAGVSAGASASAGAGVSGRAGGGASGMSGGGAVGDAGSSGASGAAGSSGSGGASGQAGAAGSAGTGAEPGFTPVYRIAARVHASRSELSDAEFAAFLPEVNRIWLEQAGICFEFEVVDTEPLGPGFDIWYEPGASSDPNGYYSRDDDIWSRDHPSLGAAPNPVEYPTARTTAHEFGHGLGLDHQDFGDACPNGDGDLDCDDLLMRSGRRGFFLSEPEIEGARMVAQRKALADTAPLGCGEPSIDR